MPDIAAPSSLYQAPSVQFNPLQQLTQLQALKNSQLQNRIAQQGYDATQAQQEAYQGATQADGSVDNNVLLRRMGQGAGAQNMPSVQASVTAQKQGAQQLSQDQFTQYVGQFKHLETIAGTLANKPNVTADDVGSAIENAIKAGSIPFKVGAQMMSTAPQDPAQIPQWLKNGAAHAAGAQAQLTATNPQYAQVDSGPNVLGVNTNPSAVGGGVGTVGYAVQKGLSPETATTPVSVIKSDGTQGITPRGSLWGGQGGAAGNGRYPQPGAPAGAAPFVPTAMAPGASELAQGSAARVNEIQKSASGAGQLMNTYDRAMAEVDRAFVGKGSGGLNNINTVLNTFGLKNGASTAESTQTLHKYLSNAATQAAGQLGMNGSDGRLDALASGQPNTNMNAPALKNAIKYVKGLQQGVLDRNQAIQNYLAQNGNNTANLGQFETQYNKAFNPEVSYIRSLSNPADQKAAMQELHKAGHMEDWTKSYQAMKQMGAF